MKTKIEQLREIVTNSVNTNDHHCVKRMILENELTFIENRHMEDYFLVAHKLISELNKNDDVMIGPGWDWMIGSHVCRSLGITNLNPSDLGITPIITWGKDNYRPTITIEVDCGSYDFVLKKVAENTKNTECRFHIQPSAILSRIKRIQAQIVKNGKVCPKLYDRLIWNEDYELFMEGNLGGIPLFDDKDILKLTNILLTSRQYGAFDELLNVQGLLDSNATHIFKNDASIESFRQTHGVLSVLGKNLFPWGFLFKEDVAWFLNGWIGLSWKQCAQVIEYADTNAESEANYLKQIYLHQGIDSGFREEELCFIWNSLFKRMVKKALPSKAHYSGRVYLSVFMARLKHEFPMEFADHQDNE